MSFTFSCFTLWLCAAALIALSTLTPIFPDTGDVNLDTSAPPIYTRK